VCLYSRSRDGVSPVSVVIRGVDDCQRSPQSTFSLKPIPHLEVLLAYDGDGEISIDCRQSRDPMSSRPEGKVTRRPRACSAFEEQKPGT
jgi:hypothetical protein